ncbi:LOW QUALITY PROTEIN: sodium/potassium/calcium exchanger 3 [Neoarius graeffei]|uniref:LOW QUALITY PROTEIN: sodium/potassium/calcium exchanger 3 n=1 Tax=Neoarius graeffei TaxID=443677 RepID=UPI00298C110C|nr:LOW QUALITY PROTEIN: sodium/potassium/calcium exchanger 3 [Neoarius graeffei]
MEAPGSSRLLRRLCVCAGLIALSCILRVTDPPDKDFDPIWSKRKLTQQSGELNQTSSQPRAAINEFPEDVFTKEQRRHGALLLHIVCAVYMFYALAIVCDVYFVPSLEKICENLHLSEDVAGATFMAAGSSAPELFTSLIGVFITKGDVGVGTIVGSAVFNILVIIGVCGIFAGQTISLTWWPLFRDSVYYIISVLALILIIYDEKVLWWETIVLISMYGIYILIMKFNGQIWGWVELRCGIPGQPCLVSSLRQDVAAEEASTHSDTSMILLKKGQCASEQDSAVVMVDELMSLHPHQFSLSEASLHLMVTPYLSSRTCLSMAGYMLIAERQRLIMNRSSGESGSGTGEIPGQECPGIEGAPWGLENGDNMDSETQLLEEARTRGNGGTMEQVEDAGDAQPKDTDEDEEAEEQQPFNPLIVPGRCWERVKWFLSWPLSCLLYYTVPNCLLPHWERWFMVTFVVSTLWIAVFSYLMVWMVTIISFTLDIPDVIMGITFLAAGTSVPDCMASLIVARQGMGDMAVSNSIGSNIFDILLGLGFPWALRTLVVDYGSTVFINSKGLVYSVILLLASVFLTVLSVHMNRWRLDRRLGLGLMILYAIFLVCSICFEKL